MAQAVLDSQVIPAFLFAIRLMAWARCRVVRLPDEFQWIPAGPGHPANSPCPHSVCPDMSGARVAEVKGFPAAQQPFTLNRCMSHHGWIIPTRQHQRWHGSIANNTLSPIQRPSDLQAWTSPPAVATSTTSPVTLKGAFAVATAIVVTTPAVLPATTAVHPCYSCNTVTGVKAFHVDRRTPVNGRFSPTR